MSVLSHTERTLTQLDHIRLTRLLDRQAGNEVLQDVLAASDLVDSVAVPPDTATMYSRLLLVDPAGGAPYELTLCYPRDAQPAAGCVSVLSPVGMALLGLRVGSVARWQTPQGGAGCAQVLAVLFQPEASGDYLR